MSAKTALMIAPTVEECVKALQAEGLTPQEADFEGRKFWGHYESTGWKVGKTRMVSFKGAVVGWVARYQQTQQRFAARANAPKPVLPAPPGIQLKAVQAEIDKHPANRESVYFDRNHTEAQRVHLQALRRRAGELNRLIAGEGAQ